MGSMLEQLKQMMGESEQQMDQPSESKQAEGSKPGEGGQGGTTDKENDLLHDAGGEGGERKLDKKSGISPSELPDEYRKQIDAYNKRIDN